MGDEAPYIVLGKVTSAYGVMGWLNLQTFADDPLSWRRVDTLFGRHEPQGVLAASGAWRPFALDQIRQHGAGVVLKLMGIDERTQAEGLKGWVFAAPREALPATGNDEYYWGDLIGLRVVNQDAVDLGRVDHLLETGANDVLVVIDDRPDVGVASERLLPFVASVIKHVDVARGLIQVDWGADW